MPTTQSRSERKFLDFLAQNGHQLLDDTPRSIQEPGRVPGFSCEPKFLIAGTEPCHDAPGQLRSDERLRRELLVQGWQVIVIRWDEDLRLRLQRYSEMFGRAL